MLNTIAPPINKHEVLKVGIYHDMVGYNNIEKIIYSVFERVVKCNHVLFLTYTYRLWSRLKGANWLSKKAERVNDGTVSRQRRRISTCARDLRRPPS